MTKPAFITFTGADRIELLPGMQALASRYPIEWGILVDAERAGMPLFPVPDVLRTMQAAGLRLSAHICGTIARSVVLGGESSVDFGGFSRVQINHGRDGSNDDAVQNAYLFGVRHGVRPVLQCSGDFPADPRVDWLYDISFGTGARPTHWPTLDAERPFCGYSGGLGPATIADAIAKFQVAPGLAYWIDMESGVNTGGCLDLAKCEAVCRLVYGER